MTLTDVVALADDSLADGPIWPWWMAPDRYGYTGAGTPVKGLAIQWGAEVHALLMHVRVHAWASIGRPTPATVPGSGSTAATAIAGKSAGHSEMVASRNTTACSDDPRPFWCDHSSFNTGCPRERRIVTAADGGRWRCCRRIGMVGLAAAEATTQGMWRVGVRNHQVVGVGAKGEGVGSPGRRKSCQWKVLVAAALCACCSSVEAGCQQAVIG